jgi:hypothetical protein
MLQTWLVSNFVMGSCKVGSTVAINDGVFSRTELTIDVGELILRVTNSRVLLCRSNYVQIS